MKTFRIATFNAENLLGRYRFSEELPPQKEEGFGYNDLAFDFYDEADKLITAEAIKEVNADILCLQEIESLHVLERFCTKYLGSMKYPHRISIHGKDARNIDVAVLSRYPFMNLRTHRDERSPSHPNASLFSRDCLEVELAIGDKSLTVYVNHLKSMIGGRAQTRPKRLEQVARLGEILDLRWKPSRYHGNFIVLGDMNDYPDDETALGKLLAHPALVNIVARLPEAERWTHYYSKGNEYRQLDYLLVGAELDQRAGEFIPSIMRKGLPRRAKRYTGARFPDVGDANPKASDHAPVAVDIPIGSLL